MHPWHPARTPLSHLLARIDSRFNRFLGQPRRTFTTWVTGEARAPVPCGAFSSHLAGFRGPVDHVFSRPARTLKSHAMGSPAMSESSSCGLVPPDLRGGARTLSAVAANKENALLKCPSRGAREHRRPSRFISFPPLLRVGQTPDPARRDPTREGPRRSQGRAQHSPSSRARARARRHEGQAPAGASESLLVSWRGPRDCLDSTPPTAAFLDVPSRAMWTVLRLATDHSAWPPRHPRSIVLAHCTVLRRSRGNAEKGAPIRRNTDAITTMEIRPPTTNHRQRKEST
jgi:hypothetical protein